jgi:hypothetical protein
MAKAIGVSDPDLEEYECPACHGLVDLGWKACPHCGIEYDDERPEPPEIIGRKAALNPAPAPTAAVAEIPSQPIVPGTRAPITIAAVPPIEEELAITKSNGAPVPLRVVEATFPNLAPTVLQAPVYTSHVDELADLERMITAAVAKALKANAPAPVVAPPQEIPMRALRAPPTAPSPAARRRGLAGFGLGLLAGGALGILVGLNWDTWIRGDTASTIGTIQLFAIIGTAAVTGAGAAVFVLELARSRRRPARAA